MNIIHVNTFDFRGGAARALYRIHLALQKINITSKILVAKKNREDLTIEKFDVPFLSQKKWVTRKLQALSGNISYSSFNLFESGIHKKINNSDADIVHLHWIGNELISISEVKKIKKPIVWTLHDMWALCGAEHYDDINNLGEYRSGYQRRININAIIWRQKKKYWQDINFNFVSPSCWLAECLQKSALFFKKQARIIRNCIDINQYRKIDKDIACKQIDIAPDKPIILFGSDGKDENPLKGYKILIDSFKFLRRNDFQLIVFGGNNERTNKVMDNLNILDVGRIIDENYLAALYSVADVFVIPSIIDNYPNTVLEAMSCGTPCVGFKVGGIPELIDHKVNGYLVDHFDTKELAEGIAWILHDKERIDKLGKNARTKIEKECNETLIAEEYKDLYESILNNR